MKTLIKILCLSVLWFSCENPTEPEPAEIDVDWVLVKTPNMECGWDEMDNCIGYYFYFTNNSNITNLNLEESCFAEDYSNDECWWYEMILNTGDGILSFTYNEEDFNFDVSDSHIPYPDDTLFFYLIETEFNEPLQRIIYNQEMNYFTLFGPDGFFGITLNSSSPNELIDYR